MDLSKDKNFKIGKIVEYFTSKNRVDVTDLNFKSAIKLDKMIEIYYSDLTDLEKYLKFRELYNSSNSFLNEYKMLKSDNSSKIVKYFNNYVLVIGEFIKQMEEELSGEKEKEYKRLKLNGFADDYRYAYHFVNLYNEYEESPYLVDFLNSVGINENDFSRFVGIIYELDDNMYEKYTEKFNLNRSIRVGEVSSKISNIHDMILNNENFDNVEFYRNLPFYDTETSNEIIDDFEIKKLSGFDQRLRLLLEKFYPEDSWYVTKFMYEKGLISRELKKISEEEIEKINFIVNDTVLTPDMKKDIVDYMKKENIPFVMLAFVAVRDKYLTNGLDDEKKLVK